MELITRTNSKEQLIQSLLKIVAYKSNHFSLKIECKKDCIRH